MLDAEIYSYTLASPWITSCNLDWEPILSSGKKKEFKKNDIVIDIGDKVKNIYYLKNGQVKMKALTKSGFEKTIWYIDSPSIVGEVPFFHKNACKFLIIANENCEIYEYSSEFFYNELIKYPKIMTSIYEVLARKIRVLTSQIEDLSFKSPIYRVAKFLFVVANQNGKIQENTGVVNIRLTHQELANITGLHRVTTTNSLKKLSEKAIIEKKRDRIIIKDLTALKEMIDAGE